MRIAQCIAFYGLLFPLVAAAQALPAASPIEVFLRSEPKNAWLEPGTFIGILGALGGLAAVLIQRYWHRRDDNRAHSRAAEDRRHAEQRLEHERQLARESAERDKYLSHVLDSLRWFEGKTQRRSIGIGIVEGNWSRFPEIQSTWTAVLTNQAVYLLCESGQDDAQHEISNLHRIMALLSAPEVRFSQMQRESLNAALLKNAKGQGLRSVTDAERANWKARIDAV